MNENPFAQYGITDPDAIAYLKRYPQVAAVVPQYGANTVQLHYDKWGKNAGWQWGQDQPAPVAQQAPVDPGPSIYGNGAENWDAYRTQARAGTEGINRMPFVFSGFPSIPQDEKASMAMFYKPRGAAAAGALPQNPLLSMQSLQDEIKELKQVNEANRPKLTYGTK